MSSARPLALHSFWNETRPKLRHAWRDFLTHWVKQHQGSWELAELHWLSYVEEFMEFREFEYLSGSQLTRKAEAATQLFLAARIANGQRCKYCAKMKGQVKEHAA